MGKIAINKSKSSTEVSAESTDAVANATPLILALAEKIKSFYDKDTNLVLARDDAQFTEVQAVFNDWPADEFSNRLAQFTEALTGFKPRLQTAKSFKIGELLKIDGRAYVVVGNANDGHPYYAVNASVTDYNTISAINTTGIQLNYQAVGAAEAGLFIKELLTVPGSKLIVFLANNAPYITDELIAELGADLVD